VVHPPHGEVADAPTRGTPVVGEDVDRMVDRLLFEGPQAARKRSAFWVLLGLAATIAAAGVLSDSTATVIGAMIVAPLMTPILGAALAIVLVRRRAVLVSLGYVAGGALVVIAIGFLFGALDPLGAAAAGNAQISARTSPRTIDLVAALATGTVGAFALVRSDVSDTLPGVAIAISLVPPLVVAGLLLEAERYREAGGALLLFGTNVTAIIATGTVVLLAYRVREAAATAGETPARLSGTAVATVLGAVLVVAVPLVVGSAQAVSDHRVETAATPIALAWAETQGWRIVRIEVDDGALRVLALGPPPELDPEGLRTDLDAAGIDLDLVVDLVVGGSRTLPAG
jgi:uncharacterized hydrophobic protein (TIGR00271 family)